MIALGIDTSNYATSLALVDLRQTRILAQVKLMLEVKPGALGLRQSDAVFAHIKNLPGALGSLFAQSGGARIGAVGVSVRPRDEAGSYMPCFLAGRAAAAAAAGAAGVPVYEYAHQAGHVMAALFGTGLARERELAFLAFHASGGTTDALDCSLKENCLSVQKLATSLDLFAGQAVDRVGGMLGYPFPSGQYLSEIAEHSGYNQVMKPVLKQGSCCLSGLENKCRRLYDDGTPPQDVARYCLRSIGETVAAMVGPLERARPQQPILFAGGVLSSELIRRQLRARFPQARFCEPAYLSADNAVGVAALACREMEQYE